jgi:hypothetical protein
MRVEVAHKLRRIRQFRQSKIIHLQTLRSAVSSARDASMP